MRLYMLKMVHAVPKYKIGYTLFVFRMIVFLSPLSTMGTYIPVIIWCFYKEELNLLTS